MNLKYFGDSYDLVKRFLLRELSVLGEWQVQPMFTGTVNAPEAAAFSRLVGAPLISTEVLTRTTDRGRFFDACATAGHLLLDPDTGLSLREDGPLSLCHLYARELEVLVRRRPAALTAVFDKSFKRGRPVVDQLQAKLSYFASRGIHGFAYRSHSCFVFVSLESSTVSRARSVLLGADMPTNRLLPQVAA